MKKTTIKKGFSIIPAIAMLFSSCSSDKIDEIITGYDEYFWNTGIMSQMNVPGKSGYNFEGGNELLIIAKDILARAVDYLPMLILIVLLLACVKIIFDGDGKAGLKRIKYVLIGVGLMILAVYLVNILSTIFFGHPVLNIHLNRRR